MPWSSPSKRIQAPQKDRLSMSKEVVWNSNRRFTLAFKPLTFPACFGALFNVRYIAAIDYLK